MSSSYTCAEKVIASLLAGGVTDLVLAPGSRSAPLALAAHRASREGRLRLHVRIDERTAGFLALGLAKGSGRCVPIVTTSGTAVGNLLPAVMEAHHARVPLLVITADRPEELVGTGANQTTWQPGIFGIFAPCYTVDAAGDPPSWLDGPASVTWLVRDSDEDRPGPVHVNIAFPEPLVPDDGDTGTVPWSDDRELGTVPPAHATTEPEMAAEPENRWWKSRSVVRGHLSGDPAAKRWLARDKGRVRLSQDAGTVPRSEESILQLPPGPRTVVVCGDAPLADGSAARAFAEAAGLPLIAEPSSGARSGPNALRCGRLLLGTTLADRVERVVMFGHPTLSRPVNRLLTRDDVELIVVGRGTGLPNPGRHASRFAADVRLVPDQADWLAEWTRADRATSERVDAVLTGLGYLSGPAVAAVVLATGAHPLVLGNSMAIRDADLAPLTDRPVFANRGLSGIDGTLSTAIGLGLANAEPTTLLVGDLAFVHDANALAIGPGQPRPDLRIVVADDAGGAIFATLEYGQPRFAESFETVFATPSGVDPVALARGYGIPASRVASLAELNAVLTTPVAGLEVVVAGIDRARRRELAGALAACAN